jgi:hypothetical protein
MTFKDRRARWLQACAETEAAWFSVTQPRRLRQLPRYRQSVRRSRKRVGWLGAVKCAAGAAFSPAGGAVILRTLAHVRVGDAAIQADTAVLRALRKDPLCGRRRAADASSVNPRNPL